MPHKSGNSALVPDAVLPILRKANHVLPAPMTLTPLHTETRIHAAQQRERMRRVSRASSPYAVMDDAAAQQAAIAEGTDVLLHITPVYKTVRQNRDALPGMNFSAQLLELGLKHNVEGLVQKAAAQLSYDGAHVPSPLDRAAQHYQRAQDNFARDNLQLVEKRF